MYFSDANGNCCFNNFQTECRTLKLIVPLLGSKYSKGIAFWQSSVGGIFQSQSEMTEASKKGHAPELVNQIDIKLLVCQHSDTQVVE